MKICREEDGEVEEVPTNSDGLLPYATVRVSVIILTFKMKIENRRARRGLINFCSIFLSNKISNFFTRLQFFGFP